MKFKSTQQITGKARTGTQMRQPQDSPLVWLNINTKCLY